MTKHCRNRMPHSDQRGVVLVISLLFLVVMTMIGVTAMSTASLQEKMAGNMRDKTLSFEAAEAALRDAEINVLTIANIPDLGDALYVLTDSTGEQRFEVNDWDATDWTSDANTVEYSVPDLLPGLAAPSRFYIEELPPVKDTDSLVVGTQVPEFKTYHRITARGVGQTSSAVSILQSTYLRD